MKLKNRKIDNIFCIFCIKITCFRSKSDMIFFQGTMTIDFIGYADFENAK